MRDFLFMISGMMVMAGLLTSTNIISTAICYVIIFGMAIISQFWPRNAS